MKSYIGKYEIAEQKARETEIIKKEIETAITKRTKHA